MSAGRAGTGSVLEEEQVGETGLESAWKTILFNCECHTFDAVEAQLIKATRCTLSRARKLSMEVHSEGLANVYRGHRERCEAVASVLGEIGLIVKVAR